MGPWCWYYDWAPGFSYCDGRPLNSACAKIDVDWSNGAHLAAKGPLFLSGPWCLYCDGRPLNSLCAMFGADESDGAPVTARGPWGPHGAPGVPIMMADAWTVLVPGLVWIGAMVRLWQQGAPGGHIGLWCSYYDWAPGFSYCDGRPLNSVCAKFSVDQSDSEPLAARAPWQF